MSQMTQALCDFNVKSTSNLNEIWCNLRNLPVQLECVTLGILCVPFRFPKWSLMPFYQVGLMKGSVLYPDPGDSWKSPFSQIAGCNGWSWCYLKEPTGRNKDGHTLTRCSHSRFDSPPFHMWRPCQQLHKMGKPLTCKK